MQQTAQLLDLLQGAVVILVWIAGMFALITLTGLLACLAVAVWRSIPSWWRHYGGS